jgi:hypothetical protein
MTDDQKTFLIAVAIGVIIGGFAPARADDCAPGFIHYNSRCIERGWLPASVPETMIDLESDEDLDPGGQWRAPRPTIDSLAEDAIRARNVLELRRLEGRRPSYAEREDARRSVETFRRAFDSAPR